MPDTEEDINKITQTSNKYYVTINMSDIFFAIPLHMKSRGYTIIPSLGNANNIDLEGCLKFTSITQ